MHEQREREGEGEEGEGRDKIRASFEPVPIYMAKGIGQGRKRIVNIFLDRDPPPLSLPHGG